MGLVPSSQAGSMPPRPVVTNTARRLARPTDGQMPSQARMSFSQPASFQEYSPAGTPDRQYMLPEDHRQPRAAAAVAAAHLSMPSSQPCSGLDSTECTPTRPSGTQSFSHPQSVSFSPAHQHSQGLHQLQPGSSLRPLQTAQRQPSPGQLQQRHMLPQQHARAMPRPLQFTVSQPGSQSMTPQSAQQGSEAPQGSQGMPYMYLAQPSQDTVSWSEETQADPPLTTGPLADQQYMHQQPLQQSLSQPVQGPGAYMVPAPVSYNPVHASDAQPSRLLMKIKSRAAAEAINNAVPSLAVTNRQPDLPSLPSLPLAAPEELAAEGKQTSTSEAAATAASEATVAAATQAAEQTKQALAAAIAAQEECKAMATCTTAAAAAGKENEEARHTEVLAKVASVAEACTNLSSTMSTLQGVSSAYATKLCSVEATCQTLLGLMHGLAAQTEQALAAFQKPQLQQPAVTVLRCLDSCTQTSPVGMRHQSVQAAMVATRALPAPAQVCLPSSIQASQICMHMGANLYTGVSRCSLKTRLL